MIEQAMKIWSWALISVQTFGCSLWGPPSTGMKICA